MTYVSIIVTCGPGTFGRVRLERRSYSPKSCEYLGMNTVPSFKAYPQLPANPNYEVDQFRLTGVLGNRHNRCVRHRPSYPTLVNRIGVPAPTPLTGVSVTRLKVRRADSGSTTTCGALEPVVFKGCYV